MGGTLSSWFTLFNSKKEMRLLVLGLDGAGKTTVLYRLKLGDTVQTIPTIGFNVETIEYKNLRFTCWDVGGQEKIRNLWKHYYTNTQGLIFVVDSNDTKRIDTAAKELHMLLQSEELRDCSVLVYANKQDMPGAMSASTIIEKLGLSSMKNTWRCQGCVAVSGDGLYEGLEWMSKNIA